MFQSTSPAPGAAVANHRHSLSPQLGSRSQRSLVTAALGLGFGLLTACSDSKAPDSGASGVPAAHAAGQQLFAAKGCTLCHGAEGLGSMMGPALKDLKTHWDRARLAAFLADPNSFLKDDARLAQQAAKYPQPMAALPNTGEAERLALADWLLR